ncbi:VanZ family protein [Flammeovirga sp. EKP202]|uniref:VanZ family protein n=1 Tax=Flammeovirga sp. EKP202 TaxID=2770592 RepID=UPI00165F446A|nr:VanZ family protein [Flammeovirga sp. EKP202]MBD0402512.1 VanZ family protein [Flammeovirga sp. EKP202]
MAKIENKNEFKKKLLWLLPSFLWFLMTIKLLLTVSPVDGDSFLLNLPYGDKIGHFGIFGIFTASLLFSLCGGRFFNNERKPIIVTVLIIIFSWGMLTELLQGILLDAREGDFWDFVADASAGVIGIYCYELLHKIINQVPIYNYKRIEHPL